MVIASTNKICSEVVVAAVPRAETVEKSDYFRFGIRDSLAIEPSFLQDAVEYAECEAIVKDFPPFKGIEDMDLVMVDVAIMELGLCGNYMHDLSSSGTRCMSRSLLFQYRFPVSRVVEDGILFGLLNV
ncbi:hypothetical protein M8C21_021588 [Ambrosia artemisiifolia]|uniref:Uncharacterized protein n=1 Tax=Ambrosia artemisiifolia TaxID=4212 RepID=A0AAD5C5T4_AMBAR|nr:hypothetical protein M8C21_021588 [Ambrosia artemisiifolia]